MESKVIKNPKRIKAQIETSDELKDLASDDKSPSKKFMYVIPGAILVGIVYLSWQSFNKLPQTTPVPEPQPQPQVVAPQPQAQPKARKF